MKKIAFILSIIFISTGRALAQQTPQPQFEPYTITAQEHQAILNYLGDVPAKYANPLINQLGQMEQKAQQKKTAEDTKKKAVEPPPKAK